MSKILIIVQQSTSNPGRVGQILQESGYTLDIRCPSLQALPTTLNDHDGAVVFGGPMSANDSDTIPFIRAELEWLPIALASGKPFLGICLGAQLLARVLGAKVAVHPQGINEIGYFPIAPTAAGHQHFPSPLHVYHWHQEGFDLPANTVLLATGETFPHQAFCYGKHAYGLQFHPEMTAAMMEHWTTQGAEHLTLPGAQSRDEQIQKHSLYASATENWLRSFLRLWLHEAEAIA